MRTQEMDWIADQLGSETMLRMDGYDNCCIGVVERFGQEPIFCYSVDKIITQLMKDGLSREEAHEYFQFNQLGAWVGSGTPCFMIYTPQKRKARKPHNVSQVEMFAS